MRTTGDTTPHERDIANERILKITNAYPMATVNMCLVDTDKVPNILTGGQRKRRFGVVLSLAALPGFDQIPDPIVIDGNLPMMVIDADNTEDLEIRAIEEMKAMFRVFREKLKELDDKKHDNA